MSCRLVIFDFDGTLADSFPWFMRVVNDVADRFRFERIPPEKVDTLRGYSARRIIAHLGVPRWKLPLIARHMRALAATDHGIAPFPGVGEMLRELSDRGMVLAVVTSNAEPNVRRVLEPQSAALITHYVCGVPLFGTAARLRRLLNRARVNPVQALYIGDEVRDAEAALRAGVPFAAVSWGYTRRDALEALRPCTVFDDPSAVAGFFDARDRPATPLLVQGSPHAP